VADSGSVKPEELLNEPEGIYAYQVADISEVFGEDVNREIFMREVPDFL